MFHDAKEIVNLLYLLRLNDGFYADDEDDVEEKLKTLATECMGNNQKLVELARGYVSFIRSDVPLIFPTRVYPKDINIYANHRTDTTKDKTMDKNVDVFYVTLQEGKQTIEYQKFIKNQVSVSDEDMRKALERAEAEEAEAEAEAEEAVAEEAVAEEAAAEEAAALADDATESMRGGGGSPETGLTVLNCTDELANRLDSLTKENYKLMLKEHAAKIHEIIGNIQATKEGVILVYSHFVTHGLAVLKKALECINYKQYTNVKKNAQEKIENTFIILQGQTAKSQGVGNTPANQKKLIARCNANDNKDGAYIKVILINDVASEGLEFKNVRQVHLLDGWWNFSKIEQIIGRAVRKCSHVALEPKKRNVQIFMYVALMPGEKNTVPTIDYNMYVWAHKQSTKIGEITRLLKENSVDCVVNNNSSIKPIVQDIQVADTRVNLLPNFSLTDKPFSAVCDFMESCEYTCAAAAASTASSHAASSHAAAKSLNEHLLSEYDVHWIENAIRKELRKNYFLSKLALKQRFPQVSPTTIEIALHRVTLNAQALHDKYDQSLPGTIAIRNDLVFFTPNTPAEKMQAPHVKLDIADKKMTAQQVMSAAPEMTAAPLLSAAPEMSAATEITGDNGIEERFRRMFDENKRNINTFIKKNQKIKEKKDMICFIQTMDYFSENFAQAFLQNIQKNYNDLFNRYFNMFSYSASASASASVINEKFLPHAIKDTSITLQNIKQTNMVTYFDKNLTNMNDSLELQLDASIRTKITRIQKKTCEGDKELFKSLFNPIKKQQNKNDLMKKKKKEEKEEKEEKGAGLGAGLGADAEGAGDLDICYVLFRRNDFLKILHVNSERLNDGVKIKNNFKINALKPFIERKKGIEVSVSNFDFMYFSIAERILLEEENEMECVIIPYMTRAEVFLWMKQKQKQKQKQINDEQKSKNKNEKNKVKKAK
jgi:regulator of protease activity HflC (stomatin/prohibitin superfamily)